eukprot:PhF_6_TR26477/c0_g1_i1/m.38318/K00587/ICMT, STE14; protein-S-isoprenylcysteine O-methyltransferase
MDPAAYQFLKCVLTAFVLGNISMTGIALVYTGASVPFGLYMFLCLSVFHIAEFTVTAFYRTRELGFQSFMVNHSTAYTGATVAAWLEYAIEVYFFPNLKTPTMLTYLAFLLACVFYGIRVLAMVQAGSNFNLTIEIEKRPEHTLVTTGLYSVLRHPSYFGWFWYCIASQVLLANPVCVVLYSWAAWKFFASRIEFEEEVLSHSSFFGEKYNQYRKATS